MNNNLLLAYEIRDHVDEMFELGFSHYEFSEYMQNHVYELFEIIDEQERVIKDLNLQLKELNRGRGFGN